MVVRDAVNVGRFSGLRGAVIAAAALLLASCGPSFQPKQARFVVAGCESIPGELDPAAIEWKVEPQPVLERGAEGTWDSVDVLNPSVVRVQGTFYNLYSGFDGRTWHTGVAISSDSLSWGRFTTGPVISPDPGTWEGKYIAANGAAYHDGREFLYWYQSGPQGATALGLARSDDARRWTKHPGPVLEPGPPGSWDESAVGDPYVIRCGQTYYMYFLGQNRFGLQRLGVARSVDGVRWQKSHANPVLETGPPGSFDENGLGEPAVIFTGGIYYMLYTGRDAAEKRRLGWARSADGVDWEKVDAPTLAGSDPWNSEVVCDPAFWYEPGRLLVWFGGGDVPSPDENLNGAIGLAVISLQDRGGDR